MRIEGRDELERGLARKLARALAEALRELLDLLGKPPDLRNVSMAFWEGEGALLLRVLGPELEAIFIGQAEAGFGDFGVDWDLINQAAADWARQYAAELVEGIEEATRSAVGKAIEDFYEQGWTMEELRLRLERWYGPKRAERIAVTEVTRAAVEGERAIVRELEKSGLKFVERWATSEDELVCPLCGPLDGTVEGENWQAQDGPPLHPGCRCWTNHEVVTG